MTGSLLPAPTDMVRFAVADLFCAIDLHGTAVPVIDLHRLLGRQPVGIPPDQHLLVLSGAGGRLAARCDRVEGLVRTSIQPSPGAQSKTSFMLGLAQDADRLLMVLDAGPAQVCRLVERRLGIEIRHPERADNRLRLERLRIEAGCADWPQLADRLSHDPTTGPAWTAAITILAIDPLTREMTIVMLTVDALASDKVEAFALEADDYIVKPFAPRDLVSRVTWAMRRRREKAGALGS
jgi:hypothetical protein